MQGSIEVTVSVSELAEGTGRANEVVLRPVRAARRGLEAAAAQTTIDRAKGHHARAIPLM